MEEFIFNCMGPSIFFICISYWIIIHVSKHWKAWSVRVCVICLCPTKITTPGLYRLINRIRKNNPNGKKMSHLYTYEPPCQKSWTPWDLCMCVCTWIGGGGGGFYMVYWPNLRLIRFCCCTNTLLSSDIGFLTYSVTFKAMSHVRIALLSKYAGSPEPSLLAYAMYLCE